MAKTAKKEVADALVLTPEEIQAILSIREKGITPVETPSATPTSIEVNTLASALITAIESTRPPQKKTVGNRKRNTPWTPTDGSAKILKLRRPVYHHGLEMDPKRHTNEVCRLLDKIRPGIYCDGFIRIIQRQDKSLDIEYPHRTNAQRLKLLSFGISSMESLLERVIDEKLNPTKYRRPEDDD